MASTVFTNGVTLSLSAWAQDVDNVTYQYLTSVAGTNTITATGPSGLNAYAAGTKFRFIPANTNTGPTTINITGAAALGARNIFSGGLALAGGELSVGIPVEIIDDGTQFSLSSISPASRTWTPSLGGSTTYTTQTGRAVQIERVMFVAGVLTVNAIGTGSQTTISGLPTAANATLGGSITVSATNALASNVVSITGDIVAGASSIIFRSRLIAASGDGTNAVFGNGASITFSGWYLI